MPTPPASKPNREMKVELKVEDALHYLDQVRRCPCTNTITIISFHHRLCDVISFPCMCVGQNGVSRQAPHLQRILGNHEELQVAIVSIHMFTRYFDISALAMMLMIFVRLFSQH